MNNDKMRAAFEAVAEPFLDLTKNAASGYESPDTGRAYCFYRQGHEDALAAQAKEAPSEPRPPMCRIAGVNLGVLQRAAARAQAAVPEGFTIKKTGDDITVDVPGMASATVSVLSLNPVEMLLANLAEVVLAAAPTPDTAGGNR